MEHHTHRGVAPSHGFKVGVGTLASLALFEFLMETGVEGVDVEAAVRSWPDDATDERQIARLFPIPELAEKARLETGAKRISRDALGAQLRRVKEVWPQMRDRLRHQLIPRREVREMLQAAGCPARPEDIGISQERLQESFLKAYHIRRRFTIFDLVRRLNLWDQALDQLFNVCRVFS
jgi:glycerol-1-phosphate dehydrogenase [NAD(P)+]